MLELVFIRLAMNHKSFANGTVLRSSEKRCGVIVVVPGPSVGPVGAGRGRCSPRPCLLLRPSAWGPTVLPASEAPLPAKWAEVHVAEIMARGFGALHPCFAFSDDGLDEKSNRSLSSDTGGRVPGLGRSPCAGESPPLGAAALRNLPKIQYNFSFQLRGLRHSLGRNRSRRCPKCPQWRLRRVFLDTRPKCRERNAAARVPLLCASGYTSIVFYWRVEQ